MILLAAVAIAGLAWWGIERGQPRNARQPTAPRSPPPEKTRGGRPEIPASQPQRPPEPETREPQVTRIVGRLVPRVEGELWAYACEGGKKQYSRRFDLAADGEFVLPYVSPNRALRLTLHAKGEAPLALGPFAIADGQRVDIGHVSFGPGRAIEFVVRGPDGATATDVSVIVALPGWYWDGGPADRIVEGPAGVVRIDKLPEGLVMLHVDAKGLADRWIRIRSVAGFDRDEIVLQRACSVTARVLDAAGEPRAGVKLMRVLKRPMGDAPYTLTQQRFTAPTDAQGRVQLDLPAGSHTLWIQEPEMKRDVDVRVGEATEVEFRPR